MKEEEESACSDGTFNKERYFTCPKGRGFFVLLENCRPDSRFANSPTTDVSLNAEKGKQAKFGNCTDNYGKCFTFNVHLSHNLPLTNFQSCIAQYFYFKMWTCVCLFIYFSYADIEYCS